MGKNKKTFAKPRTHEDVFGPSDRLPEVLQRKDWPSVGNMIDLTKLPDSLGILKDFNDRFPGFFDEE